MRGLCISYYIAICLLWTLTCSNGASLHWQDDEKKKAWVKSIEPLYPFQKTQPVYPWMTGAPLNEDPTKKIRNATVFGAMIMSQAVAKNLDFVQASVARTETNASAALEGQSSAMTAAHARLIHARHLQSQFFFPTAEWPGVFTRPCPHLKHMKHKTERGVAMAHYQIWLDFIYFDQEIMDAAKARDYKSQYYVATTGDGKMWSSLDGHFIAKEEGTGVEYYKFGVPYLDDDIVAIFEDDADSAIAGDLKSTLREELIDMEKHEIVWLGWCNGRWANPVPLCLHAYAMTRKGAKAAVQRFRACGRAVDEQLVLMCKNDILRWRTAHIWSYRKMNKNYPIFKDPTKGIFHQKRMGSFNGHTGFKLDDKEAYLRKDVPLVLDTNTHIM